jgi:hypothetical protein
MRAADDARHQTIFGRWGRTRLIGSGFLLMAAAFVVGGQTASAAASCTFDGQASLLTGVTPGEVISIACTGLPAKTNTLTSEATAVSELVESSNQSDEADLGDLGSGKTTSTGTLETTFTLPFPFAAADPNADCPPTQAQVNAGQEFCTISVSTIATGAYATVNLMYAGQPTPQAPTLLLSPTSACIDQQVTISDGAGPGNWWGNAGAVTSLSSAGISVGGVSPATTSASISAASYNYNPPSPLVPPMLSGTFTVPPGAGSGVQDVTVTEPNMTGLPGIVSATAPLNVTGSCQTPQVISFTSTPPPNGFVGGPTYSVLATGGASGNSVTLSVDASSKYVCGISGSVLTFVGPGICTIDANQAGNADYAPAPQVQQSFNVAPPSKCVFTNPSSASATAGSTFTFVVLTNVCSPSPTVTATGLPSWLTLTDYHDGYATLTAADPLKGKHHFTLTATNSAGTVKQKFVLTVKKSKH